MCFSSAASAAAAVAAACCDSLLCFSFLLRGCNSTGADVVVLLVTDDELVVVELSELSLDSFWPLLLPASLFSCLSPAPLAFEVVPLFDDSVLAALLLGSAVVRSGVGE